MYVLSFIVIGRQMISWTPYANIQSSCFHSSWWRHQMETFSALLALLMGIHRSVVDSPHKGQWRGALMFSLVCTWTNDWAISPYAGDFGRYGTHDDAIVMPQFLNFWISIPDFIGSVILKSQRYVMSTKTHNKTNIRVIWIEYTIISIPWSTSIKVVCTTTVILYMPRSFDWPEK